MGRKPPLRGPRGMWMPGQTIWRLPNGTGDRPPVRRRGLGGRPVVGEEEGLGHPTADLRLLRSAETGERRGPGPELVGRDRLGSTRRPAVPEGGRRSPEGGLREPPPPRLARRVHPGTEPDFLRPRGLLRGTRCRAVPRRWSQRSRPRIVPRLEPEVLQLPEQRVPSEPLVLRQSPRADPRAAERKVERGGRR